ncbi:hypothetical protein NHQ30_010912 [Ciborinia camelliae]|nr:hypothetical protein NHQ30_010912 [Ciborinia camelliae]
MKFQTPLLLLATLLTYVSGEVEDASRSHARDFSVDIPRDIAITDTYANVEKRTNPTLPAGKDASKLQVWIRTDTRAMTYDDRHGAPHDGLNQLMKDTGGRHVDVIVSSGKKYYEYGLMFSDKSWQTKPNGDGAPVESYGGQEMIAPPGGNEAYTYEGQIEGRTRLSTIASTGE